MLKVISAVAGVGLLLVLGAPSPARADEAPSPITKAKKKVVKKTVRHRRPRVVYRTVERTVYVGYPRRYYGYGYRPSYYYGYYRPYYARPFAYGYYGGYGFYRPYGFYRGFW